MTLFQCEPKDVLEQKIFMSSYLYFFLLNFSFPFEFFSLSQPWPYWCSLFLHPLFCRSCPAVVIFTFLMCAKNLADSVGDWCVLLIIENVFYSENTFNIKNSMHRLIFKQTEGKLFESLWGILSLLFLLHHPYSA